MEQLLQNLELGFSVAMTMQNLVYAFLGCLMGMLIGVLPGLGALTAIAMLLPATFGLPPVSALIMLAGIYYGAQYGGSTAAIMLNLPGEVSAIVTAIDGHQIARSGQAGRALSIAALASFTAGCIGTLVIAAFAIPVAQVAFLFGPYEYFLLMLFGLIGAVVLASGSLIKALAMVVLGLLIGLVGTDAISGAARYTFGSPELADGISFIAVAMGLFGYAEVVQNLSNRESRRPISATGIGGRLPTWADIKRILPAIGRGTSLGSVLGVLPGGGAVLSSFASYSLEKKIRLAPDEVPLGQGNIRGVAAPESANNAGAQTSFIPMLTLGIPANPVMALMVGAMMIHNIQPGPQVMSDSPELFWGLIASMWIGNAMLLILSLPLIGVWIRLLTVPYNWLFPAIIMFCAVGVYATSNSVWSVWMIGAFGVIGYVFIKLRAEAPPLMLGLILGPMMEENFRRAMLLSDGNWSVFIERPISAGLLFASIVLLGIVLAPNLRRKRKEALSGA